jgi:AAA-like domain
VLTFKASPAGLKRIRQARNLAGWAIADPRWLIAASQVIDATTNWQQTDYYAVGISPGTWGRFLGGKEPIKAPAFQAYCQVLGLNWQEVHEPIFSNSPQHLSNKLFYIERQPHDSECCQEIVKPGALIRIKAPQEMGKTYFMQNILADAKARKYQTQVFSFELSDSTVFTDLTKFSQWFCAGISQSLGLANKLADYWDDIFGCNYNTTMYFEKYLLANLKSPLVLALDRVDLVFEHPQIANDFCTLLRAWNQRANQGDDIGKVWHNLRLIIVHSTEVYGALDINHSPLGGVGLVVKLSEFSFEQVQELANKYELSWSNTEIKQLMTLVGGHPALIARSLEQITRNNMTISQLLQTAATESGAYSDYLRRHLVTLQQQPVLAQALAKVIAAKQPIQLASIPAFKLESMGLIRLQGDNATPRCELYRQYFGDRL